MRVSQQSDLCRGTVIMKGEYLRKKKPENLDREYEEQQSPRGQWNTSEIGSPKTKTGARGAASAIMGCFPRTSALISASYPIAPFSPGRDMKRPSDYSARGRPNCHARGFSGPLISIIPQEAREKKKDNEFESHEPTSPKVSCIGQVKLKKIKCQAKVRPNGREKGKDQHGNRPPMLRTKEIESEPCSPREAKASKLKKLLHMSREKKPAERPVSGAEPTAAAVQVPKLGQLKRFTSGRDQGASLENIYRDSIRGDEEYNGDVRRSAWDDLEVENRKHESRNQEKLSVLIAHSGPLLREPLPKPTKANAQPSEINLWKRRSVAPPIALDLESSYGLETREPTTA